MNLYYDVDTQETRFSDITYQEFIDDVGNKKCKSSTTSRTLSDMIPEVSGFENILRDTINPIYLLYKDKNIHIVFKCVDFDGWDFIVTYR